MGKGTSVLLEGFFSLLLRIKLCINNYGDNKSRYPVKLLEWGISILLFLSELNDDSR